MMVIFLQWTQGQQRGHQAYIVDAKKKFTDKAVNSNDKKVKHHGLIKVTYETANGDYAKRKVWSNAL